jgi:hypothetical protein
MAIRLCLGLLILVIAIGRAGSAPETPLPALKARFAAVEVPNPHQSDAVLDQYWRQVNAIVAASDPIADATLDARKGRVAPLMLVWGY